MILVDFSSIVHRMLYSSIKKLKPMKVDGLYQTSTFIGLMKHYILEELIKIKQEHGSKFGDLVLCLDGASNGYWRKDIFSGYKAQRAKGKEESDVNFDEVFKEINELLEQIRLYVPWRIVSVPRAEADDLILVLAKEYSKSEKVLIHSPDKDMIQAQDGTDNVFQYSSLTKKWIVPENKNESMDEWLREHICLGDAADGVPKVVDGTIFTGTFIEYLKKNGITEITPYDFIESEIDIETKMNLINNFDVYKMNKKGESTGIKDIYEKIRFGPSTLKKVIKEMGSLDKWLDSHPLYRKHYERNRILVLSEGIPSNIWNEIIISYKTAKVDYDDKAFCEYLKENGLNSILMIVPNIFQLQRPLTADDFNW